VGWWFSPVWIAGTEGPDLNMTARKLRPHGFFLREQCWRIDMQDLWRECQAARFHRGDYSGDLFPHVQFPDGVAPVEFALPFLLHRGTDGDWLIIGDPNGRHQRWRLSFQTWSRYRRRNGRLVKPRTHLTVLPPGVTRETWERAYVHNTLDGSRTTSLYITPDAKHVMGSAKDLGLTFLLRTLNKRKRVEVRTQERMREIQAIVPHAPEVWSRDRAEQGWWPESRIGKRGKGKTEPSVHEPLKPRWMRHSTWNRLRDWLRWSKRIRAPRPRRHPVRKPVSYTLYGMKMSSAARPN
jgi:hypothetical protein